MRRLLMCLLLVCTLSVSGCLADELNLIWDIPLGVSMEDAALQFNQETGYTATESKESNDYKSVYYANNVNILEHEFHIEFSGTKDENGTASFDSLKMESLYMEDSFSTDEMIDLLEGLRDMLESSFGMPTYDGAIIQTGEKLDMQFDVYDIQRSDGNIDQSMIEQIKTDYDTFSIEYGWKNVKLRCGIEKTGLIRFVITESDDTTSIFDREFLNRKLYIEKGPYVKKSIVSF